MKSYFIVYTNLLSGEYRSVQLDAYDFEDVIAKFRIDYGYEDQIISITVGR